MISTSDYISALDDLFILLESNYPYYKWEMVSDWIPPFKKNDIGFYTKPYITTNTISNDIKISIETIIKSCDNYEFRYVIGHKNENCYGYLYCINFDNFIYHIKKILPTNIIEQLTLI